jgi:hypothetical protein
MSAIKIHGPKKGPSTVCERYAVVDISGNLTRACASIGNDIVQNRKWDARRFELLTPDSSAWGGRRDKRRFPVGVNLTAMLQPEAIGAVLEVR